MNASAKVGVTLTFLTLSACVTNPDSYPVPPQHQPLGGSEEIVSVADMFMATAPDAERYIVKDIRALEGASWRWTFSEPELRFHLRSVVNRTFRLDIGVHEVTLKQTGPLKLQILINGELFDEVAYADPGDRRYEKAVPPRLLRQNAENRVVIRVLNPWQAPDPNVRLGFLIFAAGFIGP